MASRSERSAARTALKLIPWLVTIATFVWIFATTDVGGMIEAVRQADWPLFLGSMLVLYSVLWIFDSWAVRWLMRRFHRPQMRLADVLPARGATYLLGIINYTAGTAAMALYFRRRFGIGIVEGGASILIFMLADLALLVGVVMLGVFVLPEQYQTAVLGVGAAFVLGAVAHVVFWRAPWSWGALERLRQLPQFRGMRDATLLDYAVAVVLRVPMVVLYIAMHTITLRAFGIPVPLEKLLIYVPVQMFLAALPISVGGLGTGQAAQRLLYAPYVGSDRAAVAAGLDPSIAVVDAYGLALFLGFVLPRILIGLISLRAASIAIERGVEHDADPVQTP